MSSSSASKSEKHYQFITDPGHKENLSGRVGAACVTCRRKKIKCSGDVPCGTCREKGIKCEGLTPRKRPKRQPERHDGQNPVHTQSVAGQSGDQDSKASIPMSRSISNSRSSTARTTNGSHRPTMSLLKLRTGISDDSGYGSSEQSARPDAVLSSSWQSDFAPTPSPITTTRDSAPVSPTPFQDWSFMGLGLLNGPRTETTDSATSAPISAHSASHLISAAEMLERQAMSLRMLATQYAPETSEGARRQTIDGAMYDSAALSSNISYPLQSHSFDDLSPYIRARGSGSGLTPRASEYTSWWNIDPTTPFAFGSSCSETERKAVFDGSTTMGLSNCQMPTSQSSNIEIRGTGRVPADQRIHTAETMPSNSCPVPGQVRNAGGRSAFHWTT